MKKENKKAGMIFIIPAFFMPIVF